jgi:alpha-L-fucosidase 2
MRGVDARDAATTVHKVSIPPDLRIPFRFPAADPHDGIPLGNGRFGAMLWGEENRLRITINRSDFWDRRSGMRWGPDNSYANLHRLLEAGDEAGLRAAFERVSPEKGAPPRSTRLPMGRIDFTLPYGSLESGILDLYRGEATVQSTRALEADQVTALVLQDRPVLLLFFPYAGGITVDPVPAWEGRPGRPETAPADFFRASGYSPPVAFRRAESVGWTLARPGEPELAVLCRRQFRPGAGAAYLITAAYAADGLDALACAQRELEVAAQRVTELQAGTENWWRRFWEEGAQVSFPDLELQRLYYFGMYRIGCMSMEGSSGATLQGPWVEEYRLPPWQGDYHFNANVQLCYSPVFAGNHPELALPLFDLLERWKPRLQAYARSFTGAEDGLMLPHAVNDQCAAIGGWWTGAVDHGCTAWAGHLMWLYWKYTQDERFLRETAYPFLRGTMRVYEQMLEPDGERLRLPVTVSAEYGGNRVDAWGPNASFQLAAVHFLCGALAEASALLQIDEDRRENWRRIAKRLPLFALTADGQEIAVWEGQPLAESHRHHSHLAAIYPFGLVSPQESSLSDLLNRSLQAWTGKGTGYWAGWSFPWAAILHARTGNGDAAETLLQLFARAFVSPGYASTHDARFAGITTFAQRPDIMQVEAGIGLAAAVQELFLHCVDGQVRIFPAVPTRWRRAEFAQLRAEGAFLVSGQWGEGGFRSVRIESTAGGRLHAVFPSQPGRVLIRRGLNERQVLPAGAHLIVDTAPGDVVEALSRKP